MCKSVLEQIKGGLIVSCQALKEEPLYSSYIMSRMAYAAMLGGAVGIRANTVVDVHQQTDDSAFGFLAACGVEIIATDATCRQRPDGRTLEEFFSEAREKYPNQLFMADCSNYEEGIRAAEIGFDLIGTTMNGYTSYTLGAQLPNINLMKHLVEDCKKPVIAEGGIWRPEQLKAALDAGVLAAVIGGAITRPMEITKRFVSAIR